MLADQLEGIKELPSADMRKDVAMNGFSPYCMGGGAELFSTRWTVTKVGQHSETADHIVLTVGPGQDPSDETGEKMVYSIIPERTGERHT